MDRERELEAETCRYLGGTIGMVEGQGPGGGGCPSLCRWWCRVTEGRCRYKLRMGRSRNHLVAGPG